MEKAKLSELAREAVRDADLHPEEIPSIDLYLDQITSLMTDKHRQGSPRYYDRELTKTMINNYSKDGLISPIKGKKYTREQILQMLLVYSLKNTLSIGEVRRILQNRYAAPDYSGAQLEESYRQFLEIKADQREQADALLTDFIERYALDPANEADFLTLLLGLSSLSDYLKNTVQVLLEAHYPDRDQASAKEEKEQKREAKRAREASKSAAKAAKKEEQKRASQKPEKGGAGA